MMVCRHFGTCGGCSFQGIPYKQQLTVKEETVRAVMEKNNIAAELKPINHFPEWFYRNKMEFTFSEGDEGLILGLHSRKQRQGVFNLEECTIFSPNTSVIVEAVRSFAREKEYQPYNRFTHKGFLRHLIVRECKFTDEMMVGIVTSSQGYLNTPDFIQTVLSLTLNKKITSVYWVINDSLGDAVTFHQKRLLYGEPFIRELLDGFEFRIAIDSFFQTNPAGIRALYKKISAYAPLSGKENVLDLYCGVGSIGMFLAKKTKFVWGVEIQKTAVEGASVNAQINGIGNISFICSDVRKFLGKNELKDKIHLAVINPPRCGLSNKVRARLAKLGAPYMFYSSCKLETLCADLSELSRDYTVEFLEPFDFFPHTPHLEVIAFLKHKQANIP